MFGTDGPNYNLPDLRGYFVRGPEHSPNAAAGADPGRDRDAALRIPAALGGNAHNQPGSVQTDAVGPHTHPLQQTYGARDGYSPQIKLNSANSTPFDPPASTQPSDGQEMRPVNAALNWIILSANPTQRFPKGAVTPYAGNADPIDATTDGDVWLICDGRILRLDDYPKLKSAGASWLPPGPDASTFQLPDLRGLFVRGMDNGAGRDPDVSSRSPMFPGTPGPGPSGLGPAIGSLQADSFGTHQHQLLGAHGINQRGGSATQVMGAPGDGDSAGTTDATGSGICGDTRPRNLYLHYIVRIC
jgi:rhizosphere induced protein